MIRIEVGNVAFVRLFRDVGTATVAERNCCSRYVSPRTAVWSKNSSGRCPEPEIIALRTLMITQAAEVFC
jgi:hypothetical protein